MKIDQQMRKTGSIWWFIFGLALLALVFPLFAQDARFDSYEDDGAVAAEVSFAGSDFNILDIADDVGDYDNEEEEEEDNTKWRKKHEKVDKPKVTNVKHSQQQQSKPLKTTRNSDTKSTTMVDNHYNHNSWPEKYPRGSIRDQFTRDFHARCDKYSFVHRYYQMLEQPNQKYLIFLYHDRGLRNGGFGDRMGGMVTAFIHAMRFNRTLLIKASNGMHDMFRPYHPKDVYDHIHLDQSDNNEDNNSHVEGKYLWSNAKEWSKFSTWKESLTQSNNNKQNKSKKQKQSEDHFYEMEDLSDCVSNMEEGFTDAQTSRCAIDHQTKQDLEDKPVIRFASNRAYLCRYTNQPKTIKSHREVLKALNISTKNETDYFEVAGCMLRLMMWPTNALWKEVDQAYEDLLLKTYQKEHNDAKNAGAKKKQNQKKVEENQKQMLLPEPTTATMKKMYPLLSSIHGSTAEHLPFTLNPNPPLLVGLHFRCGDRHSYAKFLLNTDGFDEDACVVDSPYDIGDTGDEPGQKSKYLRAGNPAGIGQCANFYLKYFNQNKKKGKLFFVLSSLGKLNCILLLS
jgi:hypothetical protein